MSDCAGFLKECTYVAAQHSSHNQEITIKEYFLLLFFPLFVSQNHIDFMSDTMMINMTLMNAFVIFFFRGTSTCKV